MEEDNNNNRPC